MPVPPDETISPPTSRVRGEEDLDRPLDLDALGGAILDDHQVALVAHRAAHVQAAAAGEVGEVAGLVGRAAAARQADVDVDQHVGDAGGGGGLDRLR